MTVEIANRLVQMRKQQGLSQEALAEKLGVSRQAVSKWERAEASPDTDNLIMLAKLYGISIDELLGHTPTDNADFNPYDRAVETQVECIPMNNDDFDAKAYSNCSSYDTNDDAAYSYDATIESDAEGKRDVRFLDYHRLPMPLLITIIYLLVGLIWNMWHPGWILYLLIPVYDSIIAAIRQRNLRCFNYPVFITVVYLVIGFYLDWWHPGWILYLTIPVFYTVVPGKRISKGVKVHIETDNSFENDDD